MAENNKNIFDLESLVKDQYGAGATIEGRDSNTGAVSVKTPDGKTNQFDINSMLKDGGIDPNSVEFIFNSPSTAKSENGLDFKTQLGMAFARKPEQKAAYLTEKYGADNVVDNGNGVFKVKGEDGFWRTGDTNWASSLVAESPIIAASIAGTVKGAAFGGVPGAIVGGVISAGLAQYGAQKFAEVAGVRTEQDALDTATELGADMAQNLIFDVATLGAGKALKAINPFNKMKAANLMAGLVPGTKPADFMVAMRSPEDAKVVKKIIDMDYDYVSKGGSASELMPSSRYMAKTLGNSIELAKETAEKQYERGLKELDAAGVLDFSHSPIDSVRNSLVQDLNSAGLLRISKEGVPHIKSYRDMLGSMVDVVDEKAQKRLAHAFEVVENMYQKQRAGVPGAETLPNKPEVGELLQLKRFIGKLSDDLNHFASAASVSDSTKKILSKTSKEVDNIFKITSDHVTVRGKPAGEVFQQMQSKYHQFRSGYDSLVKTAKDLDVSDLGNAQDLSKMASKLNSESGASVLHSYRVMAESIGDNAMLNNIPRLQQITAGKNLASGFGGSGIAGMIRTGIGATPKGIGKGAALIGEASKPSALAKQAPLLNPSQALEPLVSVAKGNVFLRNMGNKAKSELVRSDLYSEFLQTIYNGGAP